MATQFAPLEAWADLPPTIDEQADILRGALRIGVASRRELGDGLWLERWEADLLVREGRKAGPVAREAVVLLQARAAEWATHKAVVGATADDRKPLASLIEWALETFGQVHDSLESEPRHAVSAVEARLLDLRTRLAPRGPGLAQVVAWRSPSLRATVATTVASVVAARTNDPGATSVIDRDGVFAQIAELDAKAESAATMVLDRELFVAAAESGATMVLDRDRFLTAGGSDATMVLDRDAFVAAAESDATLVLDGDPLLEALADPSRLPIAPVAGEATVAIDRDSFLEELAAYDARLAIASAPALPALPAFPARGRDDGSTLMLDRATLLSEIGYDSSEMSAAPVPVASADEMLPAAPLLADFEIEDLADVAGLAAPSAPAVKEPLLEPMLDFDLGQDSELLAAVVEAPVRPDLASPTTPEAAAIPAPTADEVFDFTAPAAIPTVTEAASTAPLHLVAPAPAVEPEATTELEAGAATGSRRLLYAAAAAGLAVASGLAAAVVLL